MLVPTYSPVCIAPCDVAAPAGIQQLGVTRGSGEPVAFATRVELRPHTTLHLSYEDNTEWEIGGTITIAFGILTTVFAMMVDGFFNTEYVGAAVAAGGICVIAVGVALLANGNDGVRIDVAHTDFD